MLDMYQLVKVVVSKFPDALAPDTEVNTWHDANL